MWLEIKKNRNMVSRFADFSISNCNSAQKMAASIVFKVNTSFHCPFTPVTCVVIRYSLNCATTFVDTRFTHFTHWDLPLTPRLSTHDLLCYLLPQIRLFLSNTISYYPSPPPPFQCFGCLLPRRFTVFWLGWLLSWVFRFSGMWRCFTW